MGQQPSALNCKANQSDKKNQISASKQFAVQIHKNSSPPSVQVKQDQSERDRYYKGVISPSSKSSRQTTQKTIPTKSSQKFFGGKSMFIPEHECLTKVSQKQFNGSIRQKKLFVQSKQKNLAEIVQSRYNTPKHLPYSQILGLTESLVYCLAYLSKKKCNRHDFYPTNIYYFQGKFKVINPLELRCSGLYLTTESKDYNDFLSPELIMAILQERTQQELGEQVMDKSDIFAIGMLLLETCTLQPSAQCYDEQSYNIIDSVIKDRINKVARVYTPAMAECVNSMLQYQIEERPDPLTLSRIVHQRVQTQKLVALEMEQPRPPPHQQLRRGPQGQPIKQMQPPPPNQMRGPPPPPYNHQRFKMQNLNPNTIAVSIPNEQYTRIGPNNQGFLSSSSLQQKLRVIQLIKQDEQQDSEQQKKVSLLIENKSQRQGINFKEVEMEKEVQQNRPKYPFVESIYSEKPLAYEYNQPPNQQQPYLEPITQTSNNSNNYESQQQQYQNKWEPNNHFQQIKVKIQNQRKLNNNNNQTNNMFGEQRTMEKQPHNQNMNKPAIKNTQRHVTSTPNVQYQQPQYNYLSSYGYGVTQDKHNFSNNTYIPPSNFPQQYQPSYQKSSLPNNNKYSSYSNNNNNNYGTSNNDNNYRNYGGSNNYSINHNRQTEGRGVQSPNKKNYSEQYKAQYSLSTENNMSGKLESLQERVERVLNMSKNVK